MGKVESILTNKNTSYHFSVEKGYHKLNTDNSKAKKRKNISNTILTHNGHNLIRKLGGI